MLLSFEEIVRMVRIFKTLGVRSVRITGGEPLLRKGLPTLVAMLRDEAQMEDLALTTNATALATHAVALCRAGLRRINVSIDSLDPDRFSALTRGGELGRVLRGIDAVQAAGIADIKTNTVVIKGGNDRDLPALVRWAWARGITPRFIELMPIGAGARMAEQIVPIRDMIASLGELIDPERPGERSGLGPAFYVRAREGAHQVGFIGAVTHNFCDACNRVRVTARGEVRPCLASPSGLSLRALLRNHDDAHVASVIRESLFEKSEGHAFVHPKAGRHEEVAMSGVGG